MRESATGSSLRTGTPGAREGTAVLRRQLGRYSWSILGGAALPAAAALLSLVMVLEPRAWLSPATEWRGMAAVGVLFSTALLLVAAPLAGVAVGAGTRRTVPADGAWTSARRTCAPLLLGALAWTTAAAGATGVVAMLAGDSGAAPLLAAHVVQGTAALALAFGGALAATWFSEPLDAGALSLTLAGLGSVGILGAGTVVERLPQGLVEWAVAVSPLLAISSAAQIDLFRTDIVYQISPLAHVQLPSPGWPAMTAAYAASAAACGVALVVMYSRIASASSVHQQ